MRTAQEGAVVMDNNNTDRRSRIRGEKEDDCANRVSGAEGPTLG